MNRTSATVTFAMCALGLVVGYGAHRPAVKIDAPVSKPEQRTSREPANRAYNAPIQLPKIRSDETLETLIAQGGSATYAGLALWMLDASAPDIAAYWEFRKNGEFNGDMKRLLFLSWTRLDPQAAIAAVAGTENASIPWWSWAAHDPKAALAAAGPDRMKDVARGIGEFHPEWLREHFDEIPEEFRKDGLTGLMTWKEDGDPVATMNFLKTQGTGFQPNLFRTLARKDPWAAFDWLEKNDKLDPADNGPVDILLDAMKPAHPQDLERLAAITPSGALKLKIEDAIFDNLLATDPEAALSRAKATDAPLVAARRLAKIGASLLATDPKKAFEIGADILAACPDKLAPEKRIETGTGNTSWGAEENTANAFMESLLVKDPEKTLEMTTAARETVSNTFLTLSGKWAARDLAAYTDWVNRQTDPRIRNAAAGQVVSQLSSQGHFQEAAEWAMSGDKPDMGSLFNLAWQWGRSNKREAAAWVESADVPEDVKNNLRGCLNQTE